MNGEGFHFAQPLWLLLLLLIPALLAWLQARLAGKEAAAEHLGISIAVGDKGSELFE